MIQIILTSEQLRQIDAATESVEIVDGRGHVFAKLECGFTEAEIAEAANRANDFQNSGDFRNLIERVETDPHRVKATTISELLVELSEDELSEDELKSRLEHFTPVAWYRP